MPSLNPPRFGESFPNFEVRNSPTPPPLLAAVEGPSEAVPVLLPKRYGTSPLQPQTVSFANASSQPLNHLQMALRYLGNGAPEAPPHQRPLLDTLAQNLGFPQFRTLQHQVRNLSPDALTQWVQTTLAQAPQEGSAWRGLALKGLDQLVQQATHTLFTEAGVTAPVLQTQSGSQWSVPARLALFNAFSQIRTSQPLPVFRQAVTHSDGQPLTFVRSPDPDPDTHAGEDGYLSLIEGLSGAMKIARDAGGGQIVIHDSAITARASNIIGQPQIQRLLAQVNGQAGRPIEQQRARRDLQTMLNLTRPPARQLPLTGQLDSVTRTALQEFELQQRLRQARDILEDERQLNPPERRSQLQALERLRAQMSGGNSSLPRLQGQLNTLLTSAQQLAGLSPSGRERLQQVNPNAPLHGQFDNAMAEKLVNSWFDIIDGGAGLDFAEQVMVHELGHTFHAPELLANWSRMTAAQGALGAGAGDESMGAAMGMRSNREGFASDYAATNAMEDFAESYRLFTYQPDRLLERSLPRFLFMSAMTGAHEGKEQALKAQILKAGYSQRDLENTLLSLQGNLPAHHRQQVQGMVDNTLRYSRYVAPFLGAPGLLASGLSYLAEKTGFNQTAAEVISRWNAPAETAAPLDPTLSGELGNLAQAAGLDTSQLQSLPVDSGYVLDYLTRMQATLASPQTTPAVRQQAQQFLKDFAAQGLQAFPATDQRRFPLAVRQQLSTPQGRAMVAALGRILGSGRALNQWEKLPDHAPTQGIETLRLEQQATRQSQSLHTFLNEVQRDPQALRSRIGADLHAQLPAAFQRLLSEPRLIDQITGGRGASQLSSSAIYDYVLNTVHERQQQASATAIAGAVNEMLTYLSFDEDTAYALYQQLQQSLNAASRNPQAMYSQEQFRATVAWAMEQLGGTPVRPDQIAARAESLSSNDAQIALFATYFAARLQRANKDENS
jgi:hypothetical protein